MNVDKERINELRKVLKEKDFEFEGAFKKSLPKETLLQDVMNGRIVFDIFIVTDTESADDYKKQQTEGKSIGLLFCRCIGGTDTQKVYCLIGIPVLKELDSSYIRCIADGYYQYITVWMDLFLNTDFEIHYISAVMERDWKRFEHDTQEIFKQYMFDIFKIDLNIMNEISGSYYEGRPCNACIFFRTGGEADGRESVRFQNQVQVTEKNIRVIRKLLEMGNENQYLTACRDGDVWNIRGLYDRNIKNQGIVFYITRHMAWNMEIRQRISVCFNSGKYFIESREFAQREFKRKYKELFEIECSEKITKIFNKAVEQEHGTVLMILEKTEALKEVNLLLNISTGIEIEPADLNQEYAYSVMSIDGAAVFDEYGFCYAIGVILAGNADIEGSPERGARYNSAVKYIAACAKRSIKALGIIVSEDRTVNIVSSVEMEG